MEKFEDLSEICEIPSEILAKCSVAMLFDYYRVVEPVTRRICEMKDSKLVKSNRTCYQIWNKGKPCNNCSSRRANVENRVIEKLEYSDDCTALVFSVPIDMNGENLVLELIKNVHETLLLDLPFSDGVKNLRGVIEQVNELTTKEHFTGLYNKTYVDQELHLMTQNEKVVLAGAIFDLDRFKAVNDTHGHLAGDKVIKQFSKMLLETANNSKSMAARIGGDEFMLLCPNMTRQACTRLCAVIEHDFSEQIFEDEDGRKFSVHASWAAESYIRGEPMSRFVDRIDEMMYVRKREYAEKFDNEETE